jgi:hypothetical protein
MSKCVCFASKAAQERTSRVVRLGSPTKLTVSTTSLLSPQQRRESGHSKNVGQGHEPTHAPQQPAIIQSPVGAGRAARHGAITRRRNRRYSVRAPQRRTS